MADTINFIERAEIPKQDEIPAKKKKFDCNMCDSTFSRERNLKLHMKMDHDPLQPNEEDCSSAVAATSAKEISLNMDVTDDSAVDKNNSSSAEPNPDLAEYTICPDTGDLVPEDKNATENKSEEEFVQVKENIKEHDNNEVAKDDDPISTEQIAVESLLSETKDEDSDDTKNNEDSFQESAGELLLNGESIVVDEIAYDILSNTLDKTKEEKTKKKQGGRKNQNKSFQKPQPEQKKQNTSAGIKLNSEDSGKKPGAVMKLAPISVQDSKPISKSGVIIKAIVPSDQNKQTTEEATKLKRGRPSKFGTNSAQNTTNVKINKEPDSVKVRPGLQIKPIQDLMKVDPKRKVGSDTKDDNGANGKKQKTSYSVNIVHSKPQNSVQVKAVQAKDSKTKPSAPSNSPLQKALLAQCSSSKEASDLMNSIPKTTRIIFTPSPRPGQTPAPPPTTSAPANNAVMQNFNLKNWPKHLKITAV